MVSVEQICMHEGENPDDFFGAVAPPIFQNSLFIEPRESRQSTSSRYSYSRGGNPTVEVAERKIALLEHGEAARCFSSGMGAISATLLHFLNSGSHVVCARNVYGGTHSILDNIFGRMGVKTTYVDGVSTEDFERAIQPNTRIIYLESPGYCTFGILDLREIARMAKKLHITTIIDNTYSSPLFQNPLDFGIDVVLHSASKYLGGHSDLIGGVAIGKAEVIHAIGAMERNLLGNHMDPHTASLLTRGLRTLPLRMAKHHESALRIAQFLASHPAVDVVYHPGLPSHPHYELAQTQMSGYGCLVSFHLKNHKADMNRLVQSLKMFRKGPSWGGFESLIMPFSIEVADVKAMGIPDGLIRLSIGLENCDDLIDDLNTAFDVCGSSVE
jgi:cystathionine beta-lyase/cystathionine gamma-synthase